MLIDTGGHGAEEEVPAFLDKRGVDVLKYLVLTHPDADHIANAGGIMKRCRTRTLLTPDISGETYTFRELVQAVSSSDIRNVHPSIGDVYRPGDASFTVPGPAGTDMEDPNNSSIVMRLVYRDTSFVMTGDAGEEEEAAVLTSFPSGLDSDVLLVGHHGSSSGTSQAFLDAVDPAYAVISVGTDLTTWESPSPWRTSTTTRTPL